MQAMRALEVQIVADTVQIKGKESGVCAVIKRDRSTQFDSSMFTEKERIELKNLLKDNSIVNSFGTLKLLFEPIKVLKTKEGTLQGRKIVLQDSMINGFLVTTNSKGTIIKIKKDGWVYRGDTEAMMKFIQKHN